MIVWLKIVALAISGSAMLLSWIMSNLEKNRHRVTIWDKLSTVLGLLTAIEILLL